MNEDSERSKSLDKSIESAGWQQIGFTRPLAGLLWNIVLILGGTVFALTFSVWLMPNVIYPFPTAMGWESMTKSLFEFYFAIADVGLGTAIQRFIGEDNVKSPRKTVQYLQFFIYFQMFTGLLQISILTSWVLGAATQGELAYAAWFFLLYSTIQWPGMLGVFHGALQAYQRFDKANLIAFVQAILLENTTRIIFILLGRYYGGLNPGVGELMGACLGSIVGAYVDDFLAAIIAARWTVPILQEIDPNYNIWTVFHIDFDWPLAKECMIYGFKIMLQGIIFPAANLLSVFILTQNLPNYPTIWGIYLIAEMVGSFSGAFEFNITSSYSEAYNNGKIRLAQDYLTRAYRWTTLLGGLVVGLLFVGAPLIGYIAGEKFYAAVPLIRVFLLFKMMEVIIRYHDKVFRGGGKPEYNILVLIVEQTSRLLILYILLTNFPPSGMAIVLSRGLGWVIKWFVSYYIINHAFMKIKINLWQTVVAPAVATIGEGLAVYVLVIGLFPLLSLSFSLVIASVITLAVALFVGPLFIWIPLYAYFGGWDDHSIRIFQDAFQMAGPSKFLVGLILKFTLLSIRKSPFHNKHPIDISGVEEEIEDLMMQRQKELTPE